MENRITESGLELIVSTALYSEDVVFKCFYWYSGAYNVAISPVSAARILVSLQPKDSAAWEPDALLERIHKDLIDFKLRDIVTKETQTIRELIIAKAFAYADLAQNPLTEISDPVGFDPACVG